MKNSMLIHRMADWLDRKILEAKHRLCTRQAARTILLVQADGHQRQGRHHQHQHPQGRQNQPSQITLGTAPIRMPFHTHPWAL